MPTFERDDLTLHYAERGRPDGPPVVLMHGLLFSYRLMERVAQRLPDYRVLLLDLHGHGKSSKPTDPGRYTWAELVADVDGLLDTLGISSAVIGGLSLGANVGLAYAQARPERCRGLILEMPVLLRGHRFGRPAFGALARLYADGRRTLGPMTRAVGRLPLPRRLPEAAAFRDMVSQDPRVAAAVLRGLLAQEPLAEDRATLARLTMPALVVGHRNDPLHVFDDARELAERLPDGRLIEAPSFTHYRLHPGELAAQFRQFVDTVTGPASAP
ncbi:MAG TPA: alpha/beta hydrolase [Acidimicrobiales bacterium]|nr:alpha/beta hydrolase [Acidimicrobiales bacterium]